MPSSSHNVEARITVLAFDTPTSELRAKALSYSRRPCAFGPLSVVAMECGWITTEVGRQPWIVYQVMRVSAAVNPAPGLYWGLVALVIVYAVLTTVTITVLRRMARTPERIPSERAT